LGNNFVDFLKFRIILYSDIVFLFFLRFICTFCNVERANPVFRKGLKNAEMLLILLAFS